VWANSWARVAWWLSTLNRVVGVTNNTNFSFVIAHLCCDTNYDIGTRLSKKIKQCII
jgi:hypothetical protein